MTEGIPPGLVDRLESLSGYRQAFPIHDPRARLNPVNYSHLIVPAGGRRFHVLSRIADAGQDYTGRSNKLAHHVALEAAERPAGNPAWALRSPGFCQTSWDGATRTLASGRRPPSGTRGPAVCRAWQEAAGDAGWAGVLIASALEPGAKPVSVIYPAGMDVLPLVEEALALVPGERQWEVTFSTYFTKLPAGLDCLWRFVFDESPEAQALRRNPHAGAIDLCGEPGLPPASPYADAARDGVIVTIESRAVERADSVFRRAPAAPGAPPPRAVSPTKAAAAAPPAMDTLRPAIAPAIPPSLDSLLGPASSRKPSRALIITVAAAAVLVAVGVGAAVYLAGPSPSEDLVRIEEEHLPAQRPAPPPPPTAEQLRMEREAAERERQAKVEAARQQIRQAADSRRDDQPMTAVAAAADNGPKHVEAAPMPTEAPLKDIQRPDRPRVGEYPLLALPMRDFSLAGPKEPTLLAKIYAASPQDCDLAIAGSEIALGSERQYRIERKDDRGSRLWEVTTQTPNAIGRLPRAGTFLLKGKPPELELLFQWAPPFEAEGGDPQMLRYCLLNVRAQGETAVCALAAPEAVAKIRLDLSNRMHHEPVKLEVPRMADEHVRLDLWFERSEKLPARILWPGPSGPPGYHGPAVPPVPAGQPDSAANAPVLDARSIEVAGNKPLFRVLLGKEAGGPGQPISRAHCVALNVGFRREGEKLQILFETLVFPRGFEWKNGNPPSYRFFESMDGEGWDRDAFEKYRATASKHRAALNEINVRAFSDEVKRRASLVAQLERGGAGSGDLGRAQSDYEVWRKARANHDDAIRFTKDAEAWCDDMLDFFGQIERELRIGYRVYIVVEGQEVELVRTVDAEQLSAMAGGF
jgi:hypothetical protein